MEPNPSTGGASGRRLFDGLLGLLQGHMELLGEELEEQRSQALWLLILGGLALGCALLLLVALSALLLIMFWDTHRVAVASGLCIFYALGLVCLTTKMVLLIQRSPRPFSASLEELKHDREQLLP